MRCKVEAKKPVRILERHEVAGPGPGWDGCGRAFLGLAPDNAFLCPNSWGSLLASLSLTPSWLAVLTQKSRIRRYRAVGLISSGWWSFS